MTVVTATYRINGPLQVVVTSVGDQAGITIYGEDNQFHLVGTHQELLQAVVDMDEGLNREREQRDQEGDDG
jgi:hypothetical protein